jgi:hypothetical protein
MTEQRVGQPWERRLRPLATIFVLVVGSIFTTVTLLGFLLSALDAGTFDRIVENHFGAAFGIPVSFVTSLVLVLAFRREAGPIEFEALGFKFKGASGPLIFWVICFLAFVTALRLLWPLGVE